MKKGKMKKGAKKLRIIKGKKKKENGKIQKLGIKKTIFYT